MVILQTICVWGNTTTSPLCPLDKNAADIGAKFGYYFPVIPQQKERYVLAIFRIGRTGNTVYSP